jgi:hypothetical protein
MVIPVTLAVAVPVPAATTQVCDGLLGCEKTVTAYAPPLAIEVENVKGPFAMTVRLLALLSCRTTDSPVASPLTVPPIVKGPPEPEPVPVPVPVCSELQAPASSKIAVKYTREKSFWAAFMTV